MPRSAPGAKVFIPREVMEKIAPTVPAGMSRTAWINYLVQIGLQIHATKLNGGDA